jgi:hypothetical protein
MDCVSANVSLKYPITKFREGEVTAISASSAHFGHHAAVTGDRLLSRWPSRAAFRLFMPPDGENSGRDVRRV